MTTDLKEITDVKFVGNDVMLLSLSSDRTFIVPLDKFKEIEALSPRQKKILRLSMTRIFLSLLSMKFITFTN